MPETRRRGSPDPLPTVATCDLLSLRARRPPHLLQPCSLTTTAVQLGQVGKRNEVPCSCVCFSMDTSALQLLRGGEAAMTLIFSPRRAAPLPFAAQLPRPCSAPARAMLFHALQSSCPHPCVFSVLLKINKCANAVHYSFALEVHFTLFLQKKIGGAVRRPPPTCPRVHCCWAPVNQRRMSCSTHQR